MWNRDELSLDSTIWYIESTLNVTNGDASYAMETTVVDSSFVVVPVVNGQVSFDEVEAAYTAFYQNVKAQYDGVANDDKQFIYAHAEEVETGLKTATSTIKLTAVVGEGPVNPTVFGATDYWYYGWEQGKCGGQSGGVGSDAALQIQTKIHMRKPVPTGYYYYVAPFSNVDIEATNYDNPNDQVHDNLYDYLMYSCFDTYPTSTWPNVHQCLSPNEMNFYLTGTEYIVYNIEKPQNLNFINIELWGDEIPASTWSNWLHMGIIHYGTLVTSPNPPEDL
jgi:hypothetical protein